MEYQDRVNRPLGMSDVDLLIYDKDIYTMYRTHEGLEPDAFRYDPIVSAGMLASDYAFAEGMQWVNLLTPDSQDQINPGDDLVVPVRTYDYYGENLPIEKKLTHEVSYTANQLNTVRATALHNEFVGDFNNYFDQESGLLGVGKPRVMAGPRSFGKPSEEFAKAEDISSGGLGGGLGSGPGSGGGGIPTAKYRCIPTEPYCVRDDVNGTKATCATCTPIATPTGSGGELGTGGGGSTGGGGGAGGFGGGAGAPPMDEPTPEETQPTDAPIESSPAQAKTDAKPDYKFLIIGIIVFGAIGYYYAKTKNKDIKTFSVSGAIVGGILGYIYAQHQTNPIDFLSKLGLKSKSESGYFIDDI
jgi:hypothetical protein